MWKKLLQRFRGEGSQPDLFQYAQANSATANESDNNKPNRKRSGLWILLLLLLLPAFFYAGYKTGENTSCEEERNTIGMLTSNSTDTAPKNLTFQDFVGSYQVEVSGHKGVLYIYGLSTGQPGATIQFQNWGKHMPEPLWPVAIVGNQINFTRSCSGRRCAEIGAGGPFIQNYAGTLSDDHTQINGTYTGGQSASAWKAKKIR